MRVNPIKHNDYFGLLHNKIDERIRNKNSQIGEEMLDKKECYGEVLKLD